MDTKQRKYRDLIERVKASYPARNPSDDGNEPRLYWCDDCKEINLWTYWQGKGNLDAKIMLVGQDWGCPWDGGSQSTMDEVHKANEGLCLQLSKQQSQPYRCEPDAVVQ